MSPAPTKPVVVRQEGQNGHVSWLFECPGCGHAHSFRTAGDDPGPIWTFNGDEVRPTFSPSLLCTADFGERREKRVCHSFVRDGRIQFLGDCTHRLAGQTVPLEPVE